MQQFVYIISPQRENFLKTMTVDEETIMDRHFDYLKAMLASGDLILAGPCTDGTLGLIIFQAESAEAARQVMDNDPSVKAGVMRAVLHPYRVSLISPRLSDNS